MIDWLKRDPRSPPVVDLGGKNVPIVIRRHANAKRMTLRLAPDGSEARVTIPRWGRTADALAFATSRRDWLAKQLAAVSEKETVGDGATIMLRGEPATIRHDPRAGRKVIFDDGEISVGGPSDAIERRLQRWLEAEALDALASDLAEYCTRAEKPAPRLALSRAKRRWGSCAPDGTIRINWRMIMAPPSVRRSVVAHEVAHLVHFDHSPRFHALLGELFEGDIKAANAWLKRKGRTLYQPFG